MWSDKVVQKLDKKISTCWGAYFFKDNKD